ncbi:MAG: hypothetical protein IPL79_02350 [Myxococcales bacterium]|nr:hypothetical protein [Myxococcales bacterium]
MTEEQFLYSIEGQEFLIATDSGLALNFHAFGQIRRLFLRQKSLIEEQQQLVNSLLSLLERKGVLDLNEVSAEVESARTRALTEAQQMLTSQQVAVEQRLSKEVDCARCGRRVQLRHSDVGVDGYLCSACG